jgi:aminocarboxymuconate-semialdehyde decarboxylase
LIIDFHNHFYPKAYIDELKRVKGYASVSKDEKGRLLIQYTGDYNIVVGPHINLKDRIKAMQKYEIDLQVLTLTTPSVEREAPTRGIRLAQLANDGFGEIVEKQPDRFAALAALPLQDPEAAATELERAVRKRGLSGATLMSNANNHPLDSEKLMPIYEKAAKLDVSLFIHPTSPLNHTAMDDYRLVPILGFGVDTALAVLRLVFSGVMKRVPNLKLIASHLGGVFPYLRGRIETGFSAYPECKTNITEPPLPLSQEDMDGLPLLRSGHPHVILHLLRSRQNPTGNRLPPPNNRHRKSRRANKTTGHKRRGQAEDSRGKRCKTLETIVTPVRELLHFNSSLSIFQCVID